MSSNYYIDLKKVTEANCSSSTLTEEKIFCHCYIWRFVPGFFSDRERIFYHISWFVLVFFSLLVKKKTNKCCLWEANLVFYTNIVNLIQADIWHGFNVDTTSYDVIDVETTSCIYWDALKYTLILKNSSLKC